MHGALPNPFAEMGKGKKLGIDDGVVKPKMFRINSNSNFESTKIKT
jgi:hypothetical protein